MCNMGDEGKRRRQKSSRDRSERFLESSKWFIKVSTFEIIGNSLQLPSISFDFLRLLGKLIHKTVIKRLNERYP